MKTNRRLRAVLQHTDTVRGWRRDPPISTCYGAAAAAAHPHPPHQRQHYQHQLSDLDDDLADVHRRYQADGFCVVRGFLRGGVLRQLQEELGRYLADVLPTKSTDAHYFDGEWAAAGGRGPLSALKYINDLDERPYFANFNPQHCEEVHPRWHAMAEVLTGYRMRSRGCEVFNKPPGGLSTTTPPHQDNFYFCLRPADAVVTMWVALDDVNRETGALSYLAGSHRQGLRPHDASHIKGFSQRISNFTAGEQRQMAEVASLRPGDLVAHHGECIHSARRNRSEARTRFAFACVFEGTECVSDKAKLLNYLRSAVEQGSGNPADLKAMEEHMNKE